MQSEVPAIVQWEGQFIRVVRAGRWEYVQRHGTTGAVGIIAITDAGELVLVEQHRPPVRCRVIEIPAGLVGDDAGGEGESIETAARRELLEETGFEAGRIEPLFEGVTTAGLADETVNIVRATQLVRRHAGGGDAHEDILVHVVPMRELEAFLRKQRQDGKQVDVKVYLSLAWAG